MKILIVEDEEHLAEGLRFNLEAESFEVTIAESGEQALALLADASFELVLLDVMLPGIDGFEVISRLRAQGNRVPVLMLTARNASEDVIHGLSEGADDYLSKPFELEVVLTRLRALARRSQWAQGEASKTPTSDETAVLGDNQIDLRNLLVRNPRGQFPLTVMEASLLRYLLRHEGAVVTRKTLLEEVWGVRDDTDTRAIDNFVVRLRRYLEPEPSKPRYLLTARGLGYRLVAPPPAISNA